MKKSAILLIDCPDKKGLIAEISAFLYLHKANIIHADQHIDGDSRLFLMRIEWDLAEFDLAMEDFDEAFAPLANRYEMDWKTVHSSRRPRMAIFVSRYTHCLADLLHRYSTDEFSCEIPLIIGNHSDGRHLAELHGIRFYEIPVETASKEKSEAIALELLHENRIDLVVLARYMQILSADFVRKYQNKIINIHHSFLPAFSGARPYQRAHERGVKLIGASSHYVTDSLDEGPIIEQDVVRISHRDQTANLIEKGRDLEKSVLARAVRWHLESRILIYKNKTVVFE